MSLLTSRLLWNLTHYTRTIIDPCSTIQIRNYAARKGTRERKQKKKVKRVEEVKVGFIPHNQRKKDKLLALRPRLKYDDAWKRDPIDNVYFVKYYKWKVYPFQEAVKLHQETHHPEMYNSPNAPLHVTIELNMTGEKKARFVDDFNRIVAIPHRFDHGEERSIIAFAKTSGIQKEALDAGAQLSGGVDLIKQIQSGAVTLQNFQFIVAHPDILPELVALRGLMKRKFPNPKNGTLDVDLATVTAKYLHGINYIGKKDEHEKDFGAVHGVVGTLDMEPKHLDENFAALVKDIYSVRPRRAGNFISRCLLWSPPSAEKFKVAHELYLVGEKKGETEEDEEEEVGERVAL